MSDPSDTVDRRYQFGEFELDVAGFRLTRGGEVVHLERRPFDLLILLVSRNGELVSRDEIVSSLWPANVIIDFEAGLNTLVRKVRQALGDPSDASTFIETVPGRGYRFIAPAREIAARVSSSEPPAPPQTPGLWWRSKTLKLAAALLFAITLSGVWYAVSQGTETTSIVVLPFENLTGDAELGYLATGLAEETSASLTRIDPAHLRVIGRVSARAMAASSLSVADIGRELGVAFVVHSTLQVHQSDVRVSASLTRVATGERVWSGVFDRKLTSVLGLQRELSMALAEQIRLSLSPEVAATIDGRQTGNPDAYRLYLQGRHQWSQFTPASFRDAIAAYERAVAEDPDYALAWAGITQTLATAQVVADAKPASVTEPARAAMANAMQHGSHLAEVRYARAYLALFFDWDAGVAETEARQAVALDPNSATAHMFLGVVLSERGDFAEANVAMRRARQLDPLWAQTFALSSMVANRAGDAVAAVEYSQQAIAIDPEAFVGYLHLGNARLALQEYDAALEAYATVERLSGGSSAAIVARAIVLTEMGRTAQARAVLAELHSRARDRYVPPSRFAAVHAALGEFDEAFEWFEQALSERDIGLLGIDWDPSLAPLRSDPRFAHLLARCRCATRQPTKATW